MDSTDSVVMGGQKKRDTLAEMPRFGGRNEDGEVFPVWMKELCKKVKFDGFSEIVVPCTIKRTDLTDRFGRLYFVPGF